MSNLSPNEDSKGTTINTGYCHQRWDGTGWETVASHCVYPYMPPFRDHPPTGEPGDEGYFPCISPFLSSAPGERGRKSFVTFRRGLHPRAVRNCDRRKQGAHYHAESALSRLSERRE